MKMHGELTLSIAEPPMHIFDLSKTNDCLQMVLGENVESEEARAIRPLTIAVRVRFSDSPSLDKGR